MFFISLYWASIYYHQMSQHHTCILYDLNTYKIELRQMKIELNLLHLYFSLCIFFPCFHTIYISISMNNCLNKYKIHLLLCSVFHTYVHLYVYKFLLSVFFSWILNAIMSSLWQNYSVWMEIIINFEVFFFLWMSWFVGQLDLGNTRIAQFG